MRRLMRLLTISALLAAMSACTWVKLQPEAERVELRSSTEVADCRLLGTASAKTKDKWLISRNDRKVAIEVFNLARNEAVNIGGNTLVEKTKLVGGRQTFSVYSCP